MRSLITISGDLFSCFCLRSLPSLVVFPESWCTRTRDGRLHRSRIRWIIPTSRSPTSTTNGYASLHTNLSLSCNRLGSLHSLSECLVPIFLEISNFGRFLDFWLVILAISTQRLTSRCFNIIPCLSVGIRLVHLDLGWFATFLHLSNLGSTLSWILKARNAGSAADCIWWYHRGLVGRDSFQPMASFFCRSFVQLGFLETVANVQPCSSWGVLIFSWNYYQSLIYYYYEV